MTFVVDDVSVQVARRAQLELGRVGLLVLLDGDFAWHGEVFVFIPHQLDEVLQFLDFLRLMTKTEVRDCCSHTNAPKRLTILI